MYGVSRSAVLTAVVLAVLGLAFAGLAEQVLARFSHLEGMPADRQWLLRGFGIGIVAIALAIALEHAQAIGRSALIGLGVVCALSLWAFARQLSGWWIDDAGITFSYSRSLAETGILTFQPGAPPTEGYSSSLWMAVLAGLGQMGADIPTAAKMLGLFCATLNLWLACLLVWRWTDSPIALALTAAICMVAPVVTWATSGQEHALQSLLLMLVVFAAGTLRRWRWVAAVLLSLFVLARPEAPLLVIAVFALCLRADWADMGWRAFWRNVPIALLPFVTFCGLIAFRVWYFGDPLPNPYYAKTSGSSFTGLLNPFGGGWQYLLIGLRDSGLLLVVGLCAFLLPQHRDRPALTVLGGLILGHLVFVIWAKGDWMAQARFLMPIVPLIAVVTASSLVAIAGHTVRTVTGAGLAAALLATTVTELDRFAATPTTPLSVVSEIGQTFATLSRQLGIDDPVLAHHDAGAISYEQSISLVDLGGLVDRDVARNMMNRPFLEQYIFEQRKPDYIFGAINFAASSGFTEAESFDRDYIPLVFENQPIMDSALSHIRREHAVEALGVRLERDETGTVVRVIAEAEAP